MKKINLTNEESDVIINLLVKEETRVGEKVTMDDDTTAEYKLYSLLQSAKEKIRDSFFGEQTDLDVDALDLCASFYGQLCALSWLLGEQVAPSPETSEDIAEHPKKYFQIPVREDKLIGFATVFQKAFLHASIQNDTSIYSFVWTVPNCQYPSEFALPEARRKMAEDLACLWLANRGLIGKL